MPAFFYNEFRDPVRDFSGRENVLFVGGFNHKPNVDGVLWFASEVWPRVKATLKDAKFIIVGSLVPEEVASLASDSIVVRGYVTDEELEGIYNSVKMFVVPLRYGAGVKGKTVEGMSKGLPMVSTSFGIEGLENIQLIFEPADEAVAFADQIVNLYNDEQKLVTLSEKELVYAKTHFSKAVVQKLIAETF
jgi:glycosyltransferase involved in cell wall biosynthesis